MLLNVEKLGSEVLRGKSEPITEVTDKIRSLANDMFETMQKENGVGLACPQIGINQRMFVVIADDDVRRVFINPQIIRTSEEQIDYEEGCLSVPQVWENIRRPKAVTVQAIDENGKRFVLEADGLLARVIQHENDHLDGILFIDRGDAEFAEKTKAQFLKRAEKAALKKRQKELKAKKIEAKLNSKK
ncbi:MAG: peptide deformylase [Treponema sp.]|nr:peptide deformylase [Treponema sp.]